jgi:glucose/mannose-6-phosphate isomerase
MEESVLDDLKYIHNRDKSDALGVSENQGQQLDHKFNVDYSPSSSISNIVLAGMGGSALPGVFMSSWPTMTRPFDIVRDYRLPNYVGTDTLFISSSYSGNTEEALSALADAEKRKAQIVVVASGGELARKAEKADYPLYRVPTGIQPRMSSFFFVLAFCEILASAGLIEWNKVDELRATGKWLSDQTKQWRADVPTKDNMAKRLALDIVGKSVIIYSGPLLAGAANKWKICFNENAKNLAWWNFYPELNHNEFIGWTSHPVDKPFAVIELHTSLEHERVKKRFEITDRLLSGKRPAPLRVEAVGESLIQQLMWTTALGDFTSIYLALLNGVDPTPVDLVVKLKQQLDG